MQVVVIARSDSLDKSQRQEKFTFDFSKYFEGPVHSLNFASIDEIGNEILIIESKSEKSIIWNISEKTYEIKSRKLIPNRLFSDNFVLMPLRDLEWESIKERQRIVVENQNKFEQFD